VNPNFLAPLAGILKYFGSDYFYFFIRTAARVGPQNAEPQIAEEKRNESQIAEKEFFGTWPNAQMDEFAVFGHLAIQQFFSAFSISTKWSMVSSSEKMFLNFISRFSKTF
jgi:hypothetical protein